MNQQTTGNIYLLTGTLGAAPWQTQSRHFVIGLQLAWIFINLVIFSIYPLIQKMHKKKEKTTNPRYHSLAA